MGIGFGFDPALIVVIVAGIGIAATIGLIGSRLLSSADETKGHLKNATELTPQLKPTTATTVLSDKPGDAPAPASPLKGFGFIAPPGERLFGSIARPLATGSLPLSFTDDDTSRRTFALLNQYYAANISQGTTIFLASLLSMSLGFGIIFVGVVLGGVHSTTAIIAAIAGILTQFIGATFLVVLRSTQAQSTTYAQTLVDLRLHDVRTAEDIRRANVGLQLLSEISDDATAKLANQTRAAIAMGLILKDLPAHAATTPAPPAPAPPSSPPAPAPVGGEPGEPQRGGTPGAPRPRAESVTLDETAHDGEQRIPEREKS